MGERWDEKAVFLRAISLSGEERERYLREACPDEASLERVRSLIRAHGDASQAFFEPSDDTDASTRELPLPLSFDEFRIIRQIGVGGMGVVYLARDEVLDRTVALKVLSLRLTDSAKARARFADEAKLAASLQHPAIVTVYKFGQVGEACYIASEYVEGTTLEELIQRRIRAGMRDGGGADRRAWRREAAEACAAVAEALQAAHAARIIHRDVKPSNILVDERSGARLTDFGIAKRLTEADLAQRTAVVGSCHYMSPEQASIEAARVDERSDIFSLGVTLYEALALRKPFDGATVHAVLYAIQTVDAPRLRSFDRAVDRDIETICAKALEKRPADRYQTAAHMAADLRCWLRGDPILARPPGALRRARRFARRHRAAVTGALVVLLVLVTFALVRWGEASRADLAHIRGVATGEVDIAALPTQALAEVVARGNRLLLARGALPDDVAMARERINSALRQRATLTRAEFEEVDASVGRVEEAQRESRFTRAQFGALDLAAVCLQEAGASPFVDRDIVAAARDLAAQTGAGVVLVNPERLEGRGAAFEIVVHSLMRHPGSPVEVARSDASRPLSVGRGYHRLTVRHPDGRLREFTRSVRLRERIVLDPDWAAPVVTEDMTRIEGATITWPEVLGGGPHPYARASVAVAPFLIDRYEVSNREYRRYLDTLDRAERERRRPYNWSVEGYPHGRAGGVYDPHPWDDLPVVGVNWFSANAYAAWAGKRLPTYAEWTLAAAGPEWREHPFATAPTDGRLPANVYAPLDAPYAEAALPVRSMPEGATPQGVHHLFGNVHEWTESLGFFTDDDGVERPSETARMLCGGAWDAAARRQNALRPQRYDADQFALSDTVGFRCALSLAGSGAETAANGAKGEP